MFDWYLCSRVVLCCIRELTPLTSSAGRAVVRSHSEAGPAAISAGPRSLVSAWPNLFVAAAVSAVRALVCRGKIQVCLFKEVNYSNDTSVHATKNIYSKFSKGTISLVLWICKGFEQFQKCNIRILHKYLSGIKMWCFCNFENFTKDGFMLQSLNYTEFLNLYWHY